MISCEQFVFCYFFVVWVACYGLFVVSGCFVYCHSPDLLSVEGLIVRYKPYLRCTRLRGCSLESVDLVQFDNILVVFAWDDNCFFVVSLCFGQV